MTYPDWIDNFSDALYKTLRNHDVQAHMPFNGWDYYPIFADLWIDKLHTAILLFHEKGLSVADHVDELPNYASVKVAPAEIGISLKASGARPEVVRDVMDFIVALLREQSLIGPFWTTHKLKRHANISALIQQIQPMVATHEFAREIGKLVTGCAALTHGLYNDWCCDTSYDVYGPYETTESYGPDTRMLIRSFSDLAPAELWPHHDFPAKSVEIYSIYKNVQFETVLVPCATEALGGQLDNLIYTRIMVDGKTIDAITELEPIRNNILKTASELYVEYMNMGFEKQKELWLSQLGYQFKPLFDLVGLDWKPSKEMVERVKGKNLIPTVETYQVSKEDFEEAFGIARMKHAYMT